MVFPTELTSGLNEYSRALCERLDVRVQPRVRHVANISERCGYETAHDVGDFELGGQMFANGGVGGRGAAVEPVAKPICDVVGVAVGDQDVCGIFGERIDDRELTRAR